MQALAWPGSYLSDALVHQILGVGLGFRHESSWVWVRVVKPESGRVRVRRLQKQRQPGLRFSKRAVTSLKDGNAPN